MEATIVTLIDELALSESQRQLKPIEESPTVQRYQVGDVSLLIYSF